METYELKYFLGVARDENFHRASEALGVSPPSLSKAVARLETELGVKLFERVGRHVALTEYGRFLRERAADILRLEEATRIEIQGAHGELEVAITGPEVLLSHLGRDVCGDIKKRYPKAKFTFVADTEANAQQRVRQGDAHLAILSSETPKGLTGKHLTDVTFRTCVAKSHPLAKLDKIPVQKVLEYPFVSPSEPVLGKVGVAPSHDGWRDDKFPRRIDYRASRVALMVELVGAGLAVAYLPDYLVAQLKFKILTVTGCPYSCKQKVRLVAKRPGEIGWLNSLFLP